jgi:hypothetical protein
MTGGHPQADNPIASIEHELKLAALETQLKQLLATRRIDACAMWDHNQHRYRVHVYAAPEHELVEPDPHQTGLAWHGRLGHHDADWTEPDTDPDGTPTGTRLINATYQITFRPVVPPFLDVRFRHNADLAMIANAVAIIHDALWT